MRFGVIAALLVSISAAQIVDTARISGTVRDASGARIALAKISVRSETTEAAVAILSSNDGSYVSPPLPPGDYEVRMEASGFSPLVRHIRLEVAQRAPLDAVLSVGAASETLEVRAVSPLLEAESSTLSNERSETAVKNLPLNGRNFAELMGLTAGVVDVNTQLTGLLPLASSRGETNYSVNGLRAGENHFLVDGIGNNINHGVLGIVIYPPIDAVQEFRMETSVADARFGYGAATVNLVFKSGSSRYHGDGFEFLRNSDLDARNFFDKLKPVFRMNQFGGTLGGPVGAGKDPKTFFFADYEGTRTNQSLTYLSTVPTEAMRRGEFSQVPQRIYDPTSQTPLADGGFSRAPFADNIVPAGLIDRVGQNLVRLYPLPNLPGIVNNYLYQPSRTVTSDEGDFRLDRRFSNFDSGFLRVSAARDDLFQPGSLPSPAAGGLLSGPLSQPSYQAVVSETHTFTPNSVNIARFGFSRIAILGTDINQDQPYAQQVGIPNSNIMGDKSTYGLPLITVTGATALGTQGGLPATSVTNNYQFDEDLSLVRGRHTVQIGGDLTRLQYNVAQTAIRRGSLSFTTAYSQNPASSAGTGLGLADLLLGKPSSGGLQFLDGTRGLRRSDISGYVQDDYKVNDRLVLNLGIRYENYLGFPWTETHDRIYNFDPPGSVVRGGTNSVPRSGVAARNLNFMPRAGLAMRAGSKTVIRAAYGIFYSGPRLLFLVHTATNPPELISTGFTNDQFDFAGAIPASAGFSRPAAGAVLGSALFAFDPNAHVPYIQQWNGSVQHQLTSSTLLSAAYAGTAGVHLLGVFNLNQPVPGLSGTPLAQRRPYPLFQNIMEVADIETSRYHALQLTAEQRLTHGLSFNASYTFSHGLDYCSDNAVPATIPIMDTYNRRLDYGNADFDIRHRLVASATYALPFKASGLGGYVVRGWQLNGILSLSTGIPFTVQSATNTLNIGMGSRASYTGTGDGSLPAVQQNMNRWFDVAAFSAPPPLQFGDVGRNTLAGPGTRQLDFSVFKSFFFAERTSPTLQFRAEGFNLTNTPQFNNPLATIGAPGAGAITSAGSPYTFQRLSREVQLAVKVYF